AIADPKAHPPWHKGRHAGVPKAVEFTLTKRSHIPL
ncbi:hypothetical protein NPIL_684401, partial [Nephila pilipes]